MSKETLISLINKGVTNNIMLLINDAQAKEGPAEIIALLQERNNFEESPLICAIKKKFTNIAKAIITIDKNLNYQVPSTGDTAMMYAAKFGNKKVVSTLINFNADIHIKNKQNKTASDIAKEYNHPEADPDIFVKIQDITESLASQTLDSNKGTKSAEEEKESSSKNKISSSQSLDHDIVQLHSSLILPKNVSVPKDFNLALADIPYQDEIEGIRVSLAGDTAGNQES